MRFKKKAKETLNMYLHWAGKNADVKTLVSHVEECYAEIDRLKERDKQSKTLRKDHAAAIRNLRTNVTALDFVAHQMKMKDPGEYVSRSGQISAESCNRILSALRRTKDFLGMNYGERFCKHCDQKIDDKCYTAGCFLRTGKRCEWPCYACDHAK